MQAYDVPLCCGLTCASSLRPADRARRFSYSSLITGASFRKTAGPPRQSPTGSGAEPPQSDHLEGHLARHRHQFTIGDEDAVHEMLKKLLNWGPGQQRRRRLLKAVEQAARAYDRADQKERQVFFHGLLTGYAVALKLW